MFAALREFFSRFFAPPSSVTEEAEPGTPPDESDETLHLQQSEPNPSLDPELQSPNSHPVPYDENLLERARTQWQFGDWLSLTELNSETLRHHPDRAKLALLAAAGHMQLSDMASARRFLRLAQEWGCSKRLTARVLAAGVHNSLGKAAAVLGEDDRAQLHFSSSVQIGTPGGAARLLTKARANLQLEQLRAPAAQAVLSQNCVIRTP